ncbi:hypothetical protein AAFA46_00405 [Oscillospiraceae bacterium WX1]
MKKVIRSLSSMLLLAALVAAVSACGVSGSSNGTASPSSPTISSPSPSTAVTPSVDATPLVSADGATPDNHDLGSKLLVEDGLGGVKLGMTAPAVSSLLGQPASQSPQQEWAADGLLHQDWIYKSGLKINFAQNPRPSGEPVVYSITAVAPCPLATARGIKLGDTKDAVLSAYAAEYNAEESSDAALVLGTVYGGIVLQLQKGVVTSIFIGASAE